MTSPLLQADCPRCGAGSMTFDVKAHVFVDKQFGWKTWHEVFAVCRHCQKSTIFVVTLTLQAQENFNQQCKAIFQNPNTIMNIIGTLNQFFEILRHIGLRDNFTGDPPEHLPPDIEAAFREGAACNVIGCYNAAATMFRLCLDFASKPLLPGPTNPTATQPSKNQRFNLGARLSWLFDNGLLPEVLRELATCVREDANDGAHAGTLTKADAEDVLDFTQALLTRLYTEPKKLELAELRRKERRQSNP
jgi:hypothetical protein